MPLAELLQDTIVAPGESELAIEREDAIELVRGQVAARLPGALEEWPEPLDGLRLAV